MYTDRCCPDIVGALNETETIYNVEMLLNILRCRQKIGTNSTEDSRTDEYFCLCNL